MSVIQNLKKKYGSFVINIPELKIKDEGISALVGPSGSGKTSFLRILSGLDACPSLKWVFQGLDLAQAPIEKRKIGFVFQSLELFPNMSVYDNIQFGGLCSSKEKEDIDFLIYCLDLSHCKNYKADQLSRGEAQRVALARALMIQPRILFLDEPFSSLDDVNKSKARKLVQKMVQHYKIPAILVSHDIKDIQALAHTVIYLKNGEVVKELV